MHLKCCQIKRNRRSLVSNKLNKISLAGIKESSDQDQCLTDEPSDILIGLDDILERMDFQEAKLSTIEEL